MSYTVAGKDTRIFRTKIKNINVEFDHFQGDKIYHHLNFDNFRTYTSGNNDGDATHPKWSDEFMFNYETEFADLLAAKLIKIAFYAGSEDSYIGEATCDLMTIATGVADCRFTIKATGDTSCGHVNMHIEMEEVAETCVLLKQFRCQILQTSKVIPSNMHDCKIYVETKASVPGIRKSGTPTKFDRLNVEWTNVLQENYFGSTVTSIMQEAGLRIKMVEEGWCAETEIGSGSIQIGEFPDEQIKANPLGVQFDNLRFYDVDGANVIGLMHGVLAITHMPKFAQMYAGKNIDGVVHDGESIPGAKFFPPRCKNLKTGTKI